MNESHQVYELLKLLSFQIVSLSLNPFNTAGREERPHQAARLRFDTQAAGSSAAGGCHSSGRRRSAEHGRSLPGTSPSRAIPASTAASPSTRPTGRTGKVTRGRGRTPGTAPGRLLTGTALSGGPGGVGQQSGRQPGCPPARRAPGPGGAGDREAAPTWPGRSAQPEATRDSAPSRPIALAAPYWPTPGAAPSHWLHRAPAVAPPPLPLVSHWPADTPLAIRGGRGSVRHRYGGCRGPSRSFARSCRRPAWSRGSARRPGAARRRRRSGQSSRWRRWGSGTPVTRPGWSSTGASTMSPASWRR